MLGFMYISSGPRGIVGCSGPGHDCVSARNVCYKALETVYSLFLSSSYGNEYDSDILVRSALASGCPGSGGWPCQAASRTGHDINIKV